MNSFIVHKIYIYCIEIEIKATTDITRIASNLDVHPEIKNVIFIQCRTTTKTYQYL
jgi:hypothetical protein